METSNRGRPSRYGKQHGVTERIYDDAETEFLAAVNAWKVKTGTRFPAATEYLKILLDLGYYKKQYALPTDDDFKLCPKCGGVFPLTPEYWHRDIYKRHGVSSYCKICRRKILRDGYKNRMKKRTK